MMQVVAVDASDEGAVSRATPPTAEISSEAQWRIMVRPAWEACTEQGPGVGVKKQCAKLRSRRQRREWRKRQGRDMRYFGQFRVSFRVMRAR